MKPRAIWVLSVCIGAILGVAMKDVLEARTCNPNVDVPHPVITDRSAVNPGYLLIAPYYADNYFTGSGEVRLVDSNGATVHMWKTSHPVLEAKLQKSGNIVVAMTPPGDLLAFPGGGTTGLIQELDWDGKVLWEYSDKNMTHDFDVLPDGSIAYLRWEKASSSFAAGVKGGFVNNVDGVWTNSIVIVNREKKVTWEWHMPDHLDPRKYPLGPYIPKSDWAHVNSIVYTEHNPITHTPAFLISVRHISTVFLIDAKSGEVIWQSPGGMLSLQHDATLLDGGNIMVLDNGFLKRNDRPFFWSRAVEIDPRSDKVVWQFDGGKSGTEKAQFATDIMGGAQRLSNGNTLITVSTANRIVEVTADKRVVWDYTNDFRDSDGRPHIVFRAEKYSPVDSIWGGRIQPHLSSLFCRL